MMVSAPNVIVLGRLASAYGVKGWLKICSYTEPPENIFNYQPWLLGAPNDSISFHVDQWQNRSKGFVAKIHGVDDRQRAELLCNLDISVEKNHLLPLPVGNYYWYQLQGLRVISEFNDSHHCLGTVKYLISTGSNDVLVVQGDSCSIDQSERLIPYITGQYVKKVELNSDMIYVDWDPEF